MPRKLALSYSWAESATRLIAAVEQGHLRRAIGCPALDLVKIGREREKPAVLQEC
jgi:hypothetical protein